MRQRRIQYLINTETGMVISRIGSEFAWPILDFVYMHPNNNFELQYELEKLKLADVYQSLPYYVHTRKIPLNIKNIHRQFWGMKQLKELNKWEVENERK